MSDDMAAHHAADYADKARMDDLARAITAFLDNPPARSTTYIRDLLGRTVEALNEQCAHIVRTYD